jgi:hypothetical protein
MFRGLQSVISGDGILHIYGCENFKSFIYLGKISVIASLLPSSVLSCLNVIASASENNTLLHLYKYMCIVDIKNIYMPPQSAPVAHKKNSMV